ncbi:MAG: hypothetical protein U0359_37990 [Byssovorax sp.]
MSDEAPTAALEPAPAGGPSPDESLEVKPSEDRPAEEDRAGDLARFTMAGAVVALAGIAATIIRTKAVAVILDVAGVGMVAAVTQLVTNATVVSMLAGGPALTTWIAESRRQGKPERMQVGLAASLALGLTLTGAGLVVATVIAPWVLPDYAWGENVRIFVALAAGGTVISTLTGAITTSLTALGDVRSTTRHALISLSIGTPLSIGLIVLLGLRGQFLSIFATTLLAFLVGLYVLRTSALAKDLRFGLRWDTAYAKKAVVVGTALVVTVFSRQLGYTSVRWALDRTGGAELSAFYNGNYQAALMIVGVYFDLFLSALFTYFAPRFAAASSAEELTTEVQAGTDFCLRLASPVVFAAITFRLPIIHALYNVRFDLAIAMLGVMFSGDILRGVAYVHSAPLLYRGKLSTFLVSEIFFAVASIGLSVGMIRLFGPMGVAYAYVIVFVPYVLLVRFLVRRACGASASVRSIALAFLATAGALAFTWISTLVPWVRWAAMPVALAWMWKTGALEPILRKIRPILLRGKSA